MSGSRNLQPNALREGLPELPPRMRELAVDRRGYPVPWFVEWFNGEPDFRVVDQRKFGKAHNNKLCWLCGKPRGQWLTFPIGPMCVVNRTNSEPPCHYDCAHFAVRACPFMVLPNAKRREAGLPDAIIDAPGFHIPRNPGAMALYTCRKYTPFRVDENVGHAGVLFELGEPTKIEWFREGRPASRSEILESIDSAMPLLRAEAAKDGPSSLTALDAYYDRAMKYLPEGPN